MGEALDLMAIDRRKHMESLFGENHGKARFMAIRNGKRLWYWDYYVLMASYGDDIYNGSNVAILAIS